MAKDVCSQECLQISEAKVRALTREVGSLREDLRRESKRRERAVAKAQECEELRQEDQARVKQLSYSNKKLGQELAAAQEQARVSAGRNRAALSSLRDGLTAVEDAMAHRAAEGYKQLQAIFSQLQALQGLLFSPPSPAEADARPPLSHAVAPRVQDAFNGLMTAFSQLSSVYAGDPASGFLSLPAPNAQHALPHSADAEKERLRAEVAHLKAEMRHSREDCGRPHSGCGMEGLIPEYRAALSKLRDQADTLRQRLERAATEREMLQQEVLHWQKAARQAAADSGRAADLEELQRKCASLEAESRQLRGDNRQLAADVAERDAKVARQRKAMEELQATISDQRADIRSALDLVVVREGTTGLPSSSGLANATLPPSEHPTALPAQRQPATFTKGGVREGPPEQLGQPGAQHSIGSIRDMELLRSDMESLDADIAGLELSLKSTSLRLHC
ncbi:hypothetical protein WJX72_008525 [[Myrmecia] bisecta]|uniref:Uncharacterized protein n=1 Tax=[Myrmecia] bisecta TaxID=41462 RepID=A0AAW1PUV1_9CHLO